MNKFFWQYTISAYLYKLNHPHSHIFHSVI